MPLALPLHIVEAVTGNVVDNSDPRAPVIAAATETQGAKADSALQPGPIVLPVDPDTPGINIQTDFVANLQHSSITITADPGSTPYDFAELRFVSQNAAGSNLEIWLCLNDGSTTLVKAAEFDSNGLIGAVASGDLTAAIAAEVARADAAYDALGTAAGIIAAAYAQTVDPHSAGALWNNGGVLCFSDG